MSAMVSRDITMNPDFEDKPCVCSHVCLIPYSCIEDSLVEASKMIRIGAPCWMCLFCGNNSQNKELETHKCALPFLFLNCLSGKMLCKKCGGFVSNFDPSFPLPFTYVINNLPLDSLAECVPFCVYNKAFEKLFIKSKFDVLVLKNIESCYVKVFMPGIRQLVMEECSKTVVKFVSSSPLNEPVNVILKYNQAVLIKGLGAEVNAISIRTANGCIITKAKGGSAVTLVSSFAVMCAPEPDFVLTSYLNLLPSKAIEVSHSVPDQKMWYVERIVKRTSICDI